MGAFIKNEDPKKWQNLLAFILVNKERQIQKNDYVGG